MMHDRLFLTSLAIALGLLGSSSVLAQSMTRGWYQELQSSVHYASNISGRINDSAGLDDRVSSISMGVGYAGMVNDHMHYSLSGSADYHHFDATSRLSGTALQLAGTVVYQPNIRFETLWFSTTLALMRRDHQNAAERDGYGMHLSSSVNRHLSRNTIVRTGYRYQSALAWGKSAAARQQGAAFDTQGHAVFVSADYLLVPGLHLITEFAYGRGDLTRSAPENHVPADSYSVSSMDTGLTECTGCTPWRAYRNRGNSQSLDIGLSLNLGAADVDLSARYRTADGGHRDWSIQLGMIWTLQGMQPMQ